MVYMYIAKRVAKYVASKQKVYSPNCNWLCHLAANLEVEFMIVHVQAIMATVKV